jgi:hypothetical protein
MSAGEKIRFDESEDEATRMPGSQNAADDSALEAVPADSTPALVEGEDYYWEGSAMVFTAAYLRRRGFCCESGCRHCPYD